MPRTTDATCTRRLVLVASLSLAACVSEGGGDEDGTSGADGDDAADGDADGDTDVGDDGGPGPRSARVAVTADWRAGTISVLDYGAIAAGARTRDEMLWKEIDLSMYPPGPYQVELTPDGQRALVVSSSGFFSGGIGTLLGADDSPNGGSVLLVDLETEEVVFEFQTPQPPMGVEIAPDGKLAYAANYGDQEVNGNTVTLLDLETGEVGESIEVGGRPEQIDLSPDGQLAVVNAAADGSVVVFETQDPAATLSMQVETSTDPSWPVFLEDGSGRVLVTDSMAPTGVTLVETGDPAAPTVVESVPLVNFPYAAAPLLDGSGAIVVASKFSDFDVHRIDTTGTQATVAWSATVPDAGGFPLGIAVDEPDGLILIPAGTANIGNKLVIMDLDGQSYDAVDWPATGVGPIYVALEPR